MGAIAITVPSPFLGSQLASIAVSSNVTAGGLDGSLVARLSLAGRPITGGDVNPDCLGVFAPISFGWPHRWPPTPAVPAIDCFARLFCLEEVGLRIRSLFHFRRSRKATAAERSPVLPGEASHNKFRWIGPWYASRCPVKLSLVANMHSPPLTNPGLRRDAVPFRTVSKPFYRPCPA